MARTEPAPAPAQPAHSAAANSSGDNKISAHSGGIGSSALALGSVADNDVSSVLHTTDEKKWGKAIKEVVGCGEGKWAVGGVARKIFGQMWKESGWVGVESPAPLTGASG